MQPPQQRARSRLCRRRQQARPLRRRHRGRLPGLRRDGRELCPRPHREAPRGNPPLQAPPDDEREQRAHLHDGARGGRVPQVPGRRGGVEQGPGGLVPADVAEGKVQRDFVHDGYLPSRHPRQAHLLPSRYRRRQLPARREQLLPRQQRQARGVDERPLHLLAAPADPAAGHWVQQEAHRALQHLRPPHAHVPSGLRHQHLEPSPPDRGAGD
mmetsp:Transcript_4365/g.10439  ORF Transcript_4365/g.10439 Transcript_4365/m.10439 type:complete len:212 (+) Transcript_4365:382-1017(+)